MTANNNLAPIALFVYNRPDHALLTLQALQKNNLAQESDLFIFCDGPKNEVVAEKVKKVHEIIDNISGFKSVVIEKSDVNKGLANSIISGVSKIVNQYEKIIVIEDDLVTSPHFLEFMNDGLAFYENNEKVISIHGYIYPLKTELPETFFLRGADCWGWATWKRGWDLFNANGLQLLRQLQERKLETEFDFDGCYGYTQMLKDQIDGKNNSWAIRWHASAFLANKLTLYPGKSLVQNIGFDDSGTHCGKNENDEQKIYQNKINIKTVSLEQSKSARSAIKLFFKPKRGFFGRIKRVLEKRKIKKLARLNK